jgi:subtilisin-like proprotein convertase family protein
VPDNKPAGAELQLVAYGLATVSTDVRLTLHVSHSRIADLRVTLTNPAGTEAVVFEGKSTDTAPELFLDGVAISGFPGDESVNGVWRVKVVDRKSGKSGSLNQFALELTSRWD